MQEEICNEIGQTNQALRDLEFKLKQAEDDLEKKEVDLNNARSRSTGIEAAMAELMSHEVVSLELYAKGVRFRLQSKAEMAEALEERNKRTSALDKMRLHRDDLQARCGVLTKNLEKVSKNVLAFM